MKGVTLRGFLGFGLILGSPFSLLADELPFELPEVEITAPLLKELKKESSQEVKVIPKEELKDFGLIQYSPLDIRERGGFGVQEDLSLRGTTFEQNLVLLEGLKVSDLQTGHHLMDLPLGLENLKALEFLGSGASPLYGAGGFGGALNFLLEPSKKELSFKAGLGSYDLKEVNLKAGIPLTEKRAFTLTLDQKKANGFIFNRDFDLRTFNFYTKDEGLTLFYGFVEKDYGARNFYTPRFDTEWEETRTHLFLLKKLFAIGETLFEPALLYRKKYDLYLLDRKNPEFYKNHHETYLYRLRLPLAYESKNFSFGLGLEGSYEDYEGKLRSGAIKKDLLRRELSLFTYLKPRLGEKIFPLFQARYDLHPGEKDFLSLGCGLSYLLTSNLKYRLNLNHSYRLPSATELYYESFGIKGNPTLSSEKALNLETGLDYENRGLSLALTLFYRKGINLIDWVYNGTATLAENLNLKTLGLTLDLKKTFQHHTLLLSYTYLNLSGEDLSNARYHGNFLRHNLVLGLNLSLPYQISFKPLLNYQKRLNQKGVSLLDFSLEKTLTGSFRVSFWGKNLLDEEYYEVYYPYARKGVLGIPQWFGLRFEGSF